MDHRFISVDGFVVTARRHADIVHSFKIISRKRGSGRDGKTDTYVKKSKSLQSVIQRKVLSAFVILV